MNMIDYQTIKQLLPHRYPFLLVDRVVDYVPGDSMTAIKNVTFNEPFFEGHFPSIAIFPGVLIVEAMAQAAALLGLVSLPELPELPDEEKIYYLVGIDKARFKKTIHPGDQIVLHVKLLKVRRNIWRFAASATVDDMLVASAEVLITTASNHLDRQ